MAIAAQRIVHVNLNVISLAPARQLFTDLLGLQAMGRLHAEPQDGTGMGLAGMVQWNGTRIHGPRLWEAAMIDLLEWQQPPTEARPAAAPWHTGLSRLALRVPDLDALYTRLSDAGVQCFTPPVTGAVSGDRFFCSATAEGAVLQLVEQPGEPELHFININCTDLERSSRWYQQLLGFEPESDIWDEAMPGEVFAMGGIARTRSQRLTLPDRETDCIVQLQQWHEPVAGGSPNPAANGAGYYRLALAVDDIAECYRQLLRAGVDCPYRPVQLDMGPDVPVDGVWALFFRDPDGTCVELIQNPEVQA